MLDVCTWFNGQTIYALLIHSAPLDLVYIDETKGSDETGQGTQDAPFKTAVKALDFAGENAKIQVKKDEEGYKEISASALKKAKKTLVEHQRKAKKQEEQRIKQEQESKLKAEGEAKALEAAKAITLSEDASLPKATIVSLSHSVICRRLYHQTYTITAQIDQNQRRSCISWKARKGVWLGPSSSCSGQGYDVCCPSRWIRLLAMCSYWSIGIFITSHSLCIGFALTNSIFISAKPLMPSL